MATLDDIVSAAAKVFRTKGYHAATVRDIAEEVGILKGSLYHHFASKEELLYLVVKEPIAADVPGDRRDRRRRSGSDREASSGDLGAPGGVRSPLSSPFVYLREREAVKRRFREMIGFSPKEYYRCWQQILREGWRTASSARTSTFRSPRTGSWEC